MFVKRKLPSHNKILDTNSGKPDLPLHENCPPEARQAPCPNMACNTPPATVYISDHATISLV